MLKATFFFGLDKHKDASFYERLILIEKQFPGAAVLLHKHGVMPKVNRITEFLQLQVIRNLLEIWIVFAGAKEKC